MNHCLNRLKKSLEGKVKSVKLTHRLTDSPACVVADENDMGLEMQRILQACGQQLPEMKPVFEINPDHKLVQKLHYITDDQLFGEWVQMLFEQALLAEGGQLDNPAEFVRRVNVLLFNVGWALAAPVTPIVGPNAYVSSRY